MAMKVKQKLVSFNTYSWYQKDRKIGFLILFWAKNEER